MNKTVLTSLIVSLVSLSGCNATKAPKMNVPDVDDVRGMQQAWGNDINLLTLQNLKGYEGKKAVDINIETGDGSRYQALKGAAVNLGIQSGLYKRRLELNEMLRKAQPQLGRIFDFSPYMLPGNVFPPVITETNGMLQKQGRTQLRAVRHSYHILTMPQLLIEPPTYLNYLVRHYPAPTRPNLLRLPLGEVEQKNWGVWVAEGWEVGRKQADLQYESDVNRLQRDLKGVRLFHDLVAKNVISMPRIARQDFGVVQSKDGRTLSIGDEVMSIVKDSGFNNSKEWKAITAERFDD